MATSISTPASLATFSQPHASSSKQPHVTLSPVEGEDGSYAVAAVQGDGVWTYDLRNMRPTSSFTVPPSTTFASSPISFVRKPRAKDKGKAQDEGMDIDGSAPAGRTRITAVAVEQGEGIDKAARGKVVWTWTGDEGDYSATTLQQRIVSLHRISHPTHPILAVHSATSFSALALDPSSAARHVALAERSAVTGDILATQSMTTSTGSPGCIVVDASGNWALVGLEGSDELRAIKQKEGTLTDDKRRFKSASISKDGIITATDDKERLVSRSIHESTSAAHPTLLHPPSPSVSLSLPTSGKPLAILPTAYPTPSILLAIPSAATPALLSSVSVSTASANTYITHLAHLGQTAPNVLIIGVVLHHGNADESAAAAVGGRSVVYTCEVTIPAKGIGLNALLGSQAKTEEYLSLSKSAVTGKAAGSDEGDDYKMVNAFKASLAKGDLKAARATLEKRLSSKQAISEKSVKQIVHAIFHTALPALDKDVEGESKKRGPYDGQMIKLLLDRRLVHDEMLKGGVVASGLLPMGDWDNILAALPVMRTISSTTLVGLIKASLSDSGTPSKTQSVLEAILALPAPAPTYRLELKRGLDVEQAASVLEVLVNWAEAWVAQNGKGIEWDVGGDASASISQSTLPSLESVITHSSHLLDSHTPLFLAHPPAYPLLERMQAALEPLLFMQADYRALRAPLDAVLTLQRRAERAREEKQKKNMLRSGVYGAQKQGNNNNNKQRSAAAAAAGATEAKVRKWQVEDFAF